MSTFTKKFSFRMLLLLAFLLIYVLAMLLVGIPSFRLIIRNSEKETRAAVESRFEDVAHSLEECFDSMHSYANQISYDTLVNGIRNLQNESSLYTRYTASDYSRLAYQLKMIFVTSDVFDDIALCFPKLNFALTKRGDYRLDQMFVHEFRVNDLTPQEWYGLLKYPDAGVVVIPNATVTTFDLVRKGLIYVVLSPPDYGFETLFATLFLLTNDTLSKHFHALTSYRGATVELIDRYGNTIYSTGDLQESGDVEVFTTSMIDPEWRIRFTLPYPVLRAQAKSIARYLLFMAIAITLLGCGISLLTTTVYYKPLASVFASIPRSGAHVSKYPTIDDLKALGRLLTEIDEKEEQLRESIDSYQDLLRYAALSRLLEKGILNTNGVAHERLFNALDMPLPYGFFSVGVLYRRDQGDVQRVLDAASKLEVKAYPIEQRESQFFLFNHRETDELRELEKVQEALCLSVSTAYEDLGRITVAYREAQQTRAYRPINSGADVVFFEDIDDANLTFYYPTEVENKLVNLLKNGDATGSRELFDQLIADNMEDEPSEYVLNRLLDDIELTLMKHGGKSMTPTRDVKSYQQRKERIYLLLDGCAQSHAEKPRDTRTHALVKRVISYIEEHLCDSQLSLKVLADHFEVNLSTLSRMIKKETGFGYLDIINRKRIELAKKHLREDTVSIKQLSASVGFDNEVTFRRQFRKHEGIPPAEYRDW